MGKIDKRLFRSPGETQVVEFHKMLTHYPLTRQVHGHSAHYFKRIDRGILKRIDPEIRKTVDR
jgi:hypothetical protein